MSTVRSYRKILSQLLPAGALGMTLLLGTSAARATPEAPAGAAAEASPLSVAVRLAAIRDAVSDVARIDAVAPDDQVRRVTWANFDIYWPFWNDWHNGWRNWHNDWKNGWNNWRNGWNNWANGWHNGGWHNY